MLPSVKEIEPWITGLADILQNPVYHGEGDVLTHTHMVMDSLSRMPAYVALPEDEQALMMAAASLHDIGKMKTTKLEDDRWISPHHSAVGASMAREMLMTRFDMGGDAESLRQREAICELVRLHMKPLYALESKDPGRMIRQMASIHELTPFFTLERLAMLAEADNRGRVCADMSDRLEDIALFRLLAQEQGCCSDAFSYPDAYSRCADLSGRSTVPGQPLYNDTWGTVVMLSGLPGTGKDTFAREHYAGLPMLSLDDLRQTMRIRPTENQGRVAQAARERAREYLRAKQPFVFNATNLSAMIRGKWIGLFRQYGASVHIIYLETAWKERIRRNSGRAGAVPETAIADMLRHLEPPLLTEAEDVDWICV